MPADLQTDFYKTTKLFTGGYDKDIVITDFQTGIILARVPGHTGLVRVFVMTKDRRYFLSGSNDNRVIVWRTETLLDAQPQRQLTFTEHLDSVLTIDLLSDDRTVATSDLKGAGSPVLVWNIETGVVLRKIKTGGSWQRATGLDIKRNIFISSPYGLHEIGFWNVLTGDKIRSIPLDHQEFTVTQDSNFLIAWSSTKVFIVRFDTFEIIAEIDMPTSWSTGNLVHY